MLMNQPTVRAVHRITLKPDSDGRITVRALDLGARQLLPDGAAVVLEVGTGWWLTRSDVDHIAAALSNVGHISLSGVFAERHGGRGQFGVIYGLEQIAQELHRAITNPTLMVQTA